MLIICLFVLINFSLLTICLSPTILFQVFLASTHFLSFISIDENIFFFMNISVIKFHGYIEIYRENIDKNFQK